MASSPKPRTTKKSLEQAAPLLLEVVQEFILAYDLEMHLSGKKPAKVEPSYVTKARQAVAIALGIASNDSLKQQK